VLYTKQMQDVLVLNVWSLEMTRKKHRCKPWECPYCEKLIQSANGLATTAHLRKHVREGLLFESHSRDNYGNKICNFSSHKGDSDVYS
jgi:hypothetical protein